MDKAVQGQKQLQIGPSGCAVGQQLRHCGCAGVVDPRFAASWLTVNAASLAQAASLAVACVNA